MRRLLIIALLTGLLGISLAANIYLFDTLMRFYRAPHDVRLDPVGLNAFRPIVPDPERTTVVFFGDSRTEHWPSPDNLPAYEFINRGIGAQTSAQVALRFAAHVEPLQPDILVVQVCVNDLKTIPLFPHRKAEIVGGCQANLDAIITQAHALDTQVILTTVFPVGTPPLERMPVWSDDIALAVNEVNEYILARTDVIVLDAYALLVDENGLARADYSFDELHLNRAGYAVLNAALTETLQNIAE